MPIYRMYLLNPRSGGIDGFEEISSSDDAGAMRLAAALGHDGPRELWIGSRQIGRFGSRFQTNAELAAAAP